MILKYVLFGKQRVILACGFWVFYSRMLALLVSKTLGYKPYSAYHFLFFSFVFMGNIFLIFNCSFLTYTVSPFWYVRMKGWTLAAGMKTLLQSFMVSWGKKSSIVFPALQSGNMYLYIHLSMHFLCPLFNAEPQGSGCPSLKVIVEEVAYIFAEQVASPSQTYSAH